MLSKTQQATLAISQKITKTVKMKLKLRINQMTQQTINLHKKPMKMLIHRTKLMIKLTLKRKVKRLQEMVMEPRLKMSKTMRIRKRLTPSRKKKP